MSWRMKLLWSTLLPLACGSLWGCQTVDTPSAPVPPLQLLAAASVQLPPACEATASVIVEFTVRPDGVTTGIQTPAVPDCLRHALTAWVASFRYSPPGAASVESSVEWLLVSAKKGS